MNKLKATVALALLSMAITSCSPKITPATSVSGNSNAQTTTSAPDNANTVPVQIPQNDLSSKGAGEVHISDANKQ